MIANCFPTNNHRYPWIRKRAWRWPDIQALINDKVSQALEAAGAPAGSPAAVRQSAKPQFGDYQANGVMGVAKRLGTNPRCSKSIGRSKPDSVLRNEIAGPGFTNIFLDEAFLAQQADAALADSRLGVAAAGFDHCCWHTLLKRCKRNALATYVQRSSVMLLFVHEFLGHKVIRASHIWWLGYSIHFLSQALSASSWNWRSFNGTFLESWAVLPWI